MHRRLSADWSFACIPLVQRLGDHRNAMTVALYAALAWTSWAAVPSALRSLTAALSGRGTVIQQHQCVNSTARSVYRASVRARMVDSRAPCQSIKAVVSSAGGVLLS